jgi:hypothetical protein
MCECACRKPKIKQPKIPAAFPAGTVLYDTHVNDDMERIVTGDIPVWLAKKMDTGSELQFHYWRGYCVLVLAQTPALA